jgi:hypothetical protein
MKMFGDLDMSAVIAIDDLVGREVVCSAVGFQPGRIYTVLAVDAPSLTARLSNNAWVLVSFLRYA